MNHASFGLRRAALPLIAALVLVMAACTSGDGASAGADASDDSSAGGTVAVTNGALTITAADMAFDANVIQAPAGETWTVTLVNNDSLPHNFSIYTEEGGEEIVTGTVINGGETVEVEVPALDAGEYYFVCDVHPAEMNGMVVVEG